MRRPHVPRDWTSQQALSIVDFLDSLLAEIWHVHGDAIVYAITEREHETDPRQLSLALSVELEPPF